MVPPREPDRALAGAGLWLQAGFRAALERWIARRVPDRATAEDLTQDVLVHLMLADGRRGLVDADHAQRLARTLARAFVANEWRQRARKPQTNCSLDEFVARDGRSRLEHDRADLAALRGRLEPLLGDSQRRLLAAYVDDNVAPIRQLALRLRTGRSHVRRMLTGIAKKIAKLSAERRE
jgi:DNA-directed RNA polymerase specialized sigma24 family protein